MKTRVLVLEDEHHARIAIREFLTMAGFEVRGVSDAGQAIEIGMNFRPHVLVCDYLLPGTVNGVHVATRLFESLPELKIFMMSGLPGSEIELALNDLPICGFLGKPLSLLELKRRIREVCGTD